jgi:hypothetical protein
MVHHGSALEFKGKKFKLTEKYFQIFTHKLDWEIGVVAAVVSQVFASLTSSLEISLLMPQQGWLSLLPRTYSSGFPQHSPG